MKVFYTCGLLFDVCEVFGEVTEELMKQRKYAKWKATYIHNCLKNGETPIPGPMGGGEEGSILIIIITPLVENININIYGPFFFVCVCVYY